MALNKDMHPRNPYKDKPPDFKALALEFPEFRKHCKLVSNGKVIMNFQDDAAVRCLTQTLLKKDFGLEVELPIGTLVPRIPSRLNYILALEDLLKLNKLDRDVLGIDIGTGASCIYALLGAKKFGWKFVATDGDAKSVDTAHRNVANNKLSAQICVALVDPTAKTILMDIVNELGDNKVFTFCMCNPPFFEYNETNHKFCAEPSLGGEKYSNRVILDERSAPHSTTYASSAELEVEGGEVQFVNRIIDDSIILRDRIKLYTSLLGRKQSIRPLKRRLERLGDDVKLSVSTINQGKTQRWVIAWTFSKDVVLASTERKILLNCPKPGLLRLEEQMKALEAKLKKENETSIIFECRTVTWTHQRARKRAEARLAADCNYLNSIKRQKLQFNDVGCQIFLGVGDGKDSLSDSGNFVLCEMENSETPNKVNTIVQAYFPLPTDGMTYQGIRFRATLNSSNANEDEINFELLNGPKHLIHQLLQHLRNVFSKKNVI
ncbi:unnamed protein product [Caenorhabditis bovis]|uniref:U6 small nuclear RNA (adenine-(43)-N(6))-methyltransferase n=1 Tax=Caenorhabditis bovis TaxID=2654633 RepID=A0A8S1EMK4_9PELO|nr:unnamed protein product [Caenorhabditis bovis]